MTTLTETAYFGRKFINIGAIALAIILVLRIVFGFATDLWQKLFPPPPPPANMAFGPLPYPLAQNNIATPSGAITYVLETVDGGFPETPYTLKVYFMPRLGATFGSFDRMKVSAENLGFKDIPLRAGPTIWRFTDKDNPLRTLDIDEISGNFRLMYNYVSDVSIFTSKNFTSSDQAISTARTFFEHVSGLPTTYYFKYDAGALVSTTSLSNADAVSVTFARPDIDKMPVVSPDFRQGLVSALISGSTDPKKTVLEGRFFTTDIDTQNWGTYPIVKAADAFESLKSGKAIYASLPLPMASTISIRKIYLAYLDPYPAQSYLQPVWVFSDEKGFVAYIPGVLP